MRFVIAIEGGPHDGRYECSTDDESTTDRVSGAQAILLACREKEVGGRFFMAPHYGIYVMREQGEDAVRASGMKGHTYEVVKREESAEKLLILCKHVPDD